MTSGNHVVRRRGAVIGSLTEAQRDWHAIRTGTCSATALRLPVVLVLETYERGIQQDMKKTVWATGQCASWYNDKHGNNTTLWPGFTFSFRRMLQRFDLGSYRSVASDDRAAHTGTTGDKEYAA